MSSHIALYLNSPDIHIHKSHSLESHSPEVHSLKVHTLEVHTLKAYSLEAQSQDRYRLYMQGSKHVQYIAFPRLLLMLHQP